MGSFKSDYYQVRAQPAKVQLAVVIILSALLALVGVLMFGIATSITLVGFFITLGAFAFLALLIWCVKTVAQSKL